MLKLLDYYYLVLVRCFGWTNQIPAFMTLFFLLNLAAFAVLISLYLILVSAIGAFLVMFILDRRYNEKRAEALKAKYKRESRNSRCRGIMYVIAYKVFSILFFIWAASQLTR